MRITIEKWSLICFLSVLFLALAVNIPASHAQDSPQWHLPDGAIARLGKGIIQELAYSPDGSQLVVGSSIGVWLYDTVTYQEVALLTGRTHGVASVAYSPDGTTLASGSYQEVHLWDVATGNLINTLEGHESYVGSIAFSPDGNTLASGSYNWVRLWDVATGNLTNTLEGNGSSVAFSPDGNTLASGSRNRVRLWDVATGNLINTLEGGGNSVAFSLGGTILASAGGWRNRIRLWDVATGSLINTLEEHTDRVLSVAFSPDGSTLASGSQDNTVRLWDVATGNLTNTLEEHTGRVESITFSPDGITLASGSSDGTVRLWDMATGSLINTLEGHTGGVSSVAFSPDGNTLASGSGYYDEEIPDDELVWGWDNTVRLWDVATGSLINTLEHTSGVLSVAYSSDGTTLASGSQDNRVRLWDVATGNLINTLQGGGNSVAFSPDGNTLASGSGDNTVRLWDAATGNLIKILTGHTDHVSSVVFSPDGTTLASGSYREIRLWDVATRSLINTLQGGGNSIAFSPDGNTLAVGRYGRVNLWDTATGDLINTLGDFSSYSLSVMFSPDGTTLASGSWDNTVRLWDVATGNRINTLTGHIDWVRSVAFSPDGATLASGGNDGTVLLWNVPTPPIGFDPPTIADQTYTLDTPITPLALPLAIGGTPPYTHTLSPIPDGLYFDAFALSLNGTPTVEGTTNVTYIATDTTGDAATLNFTITVTGTGPGPGGPDPLDVNGNGRVDVLDLVWVAVSYGMRGDTLPADVNADGVVNVQDLVAVAGAIDAGAALPTKIAEEVLFAAEAAAAELEGVPGAPGMRFNTARQGAASHLTAYSNIANALSEARTFGTGDARLGKWVPLLEELLQVLAERGAIPETTALLANYPNPFNPETWIPYHLAKGADVTLTVYDVRGSIVRELRLGHQPAGVYESRGRAAYWDGKNQLGEKVASGLYFYTLTAGDFTATRKLLIAK